MKRILCFVLALAIVTVSLSGCWWYKNYMGKRPCDQPNTKWMSEDGQIYFWVKEKGPGTGKMIIGDETIDIHVGIGPALDIDIVHLDSVIGDSVNEVSFEHWVGDFKYKDHFTATVKRTTFFHVGDKIVFYRVDDDTSTPDYAISQPDR